MNKVFRKFVALVVAGTMALTGAMPALAQQQSNNVCTPGGIAFGFFNGVQTTDATATVALMTLKSLYGTKLEATGETIRYEKFYNYTNGFEDFVETFEQRLIEQDSILQGRFELYLEVMSGVGSWWEAIVANVVGTALVLDALMEDIQARAIALLSGLLGSPPTSVTYAEHRLRIDNYVLEGKKMVFFAHSQGNLFVNPAADYARSKSSAAAVKVVHVAPASPTLRGSHVLADKDLVINGLRAVGSVAPITHIIPGYLARPAGLNGQKDPLGHGLLEIYVNPALNVSASVRSLVNAALNEVTAPPAQASAGFFTATLTWDGTGDVDLHTFEPGGAHVFYRAKTGNAGYLDYDNTVANGPEHYYASCEKDKLEVGTYQVKLANYARAAGRTATVQIASSKDGVLATRSAVMGGETRDTPTFSLFNVIVTKNAEGEYKVDVQ